jgi:predicted CoA-substrate-specific enzyme activase
MQQIYKVGIDIGSTTTKVVALDASGSVVFSHYARHYSEIEASLERTLELLSEAIGDKPFTLAMTGSAGMGVAQRLGIPFEQEVIACATAVKARIPQTDTVIELGGEDAKITYFGEAPEQRMNGACAGGTGSFIDHMASLLSTDAAGLNELASKGTQIHTIASRCGVFAKTDVQALMNEGASKPDIALSVLQAVVNQTIGNLAQGRPIKGRVAMLGGPLHFLPELRKRFIETLQLAPDQIVEVKDGCYFVAIGAALSEDAKPMDLASLKKLIEKASETKSRTAASIGRPLFKDEKELEAFRARHAQHKVPRASLDDYKGPVWIGIDAGSTTTKMAVVGKNKELLYTVYGSNRGTPLATVIAELEEVYAKLGEDKYVAGALATGYGEALVKAALHADFGEVETFAHLRAAQEFCPDVTFVMDIGGQDIKCFFVDRGTIGSITLNEACSAGCGSFIENFAQGLKMTSHEFAELALKSRDPVDLGIRCTVFMNSRVKQAQKEGAPVEDIAAGISLSVIKNALFKVMQLKNVSDLGEHIVVQGGTFLNDAVLRSLEMLLGRDVIRPDIAGLMGAYGAAILALEKGSQKSTLLGPDELLAFSSKSRVYRCRKCGNNCLITMQRFNDGSRFYSGNRCEKGISHKDAVTEEVPNIYKWKYERLFEHYKPLENAPRGVIGIPRCLNMYEDYPLWFTLFTELGYRVVISGKSTASLYYKGIATIPSDSLCYPAKLAHGHIEDLADMGVKKIFYPVIPYNMIDTEHPGDNHYNCPIVASYPENIRGNMDVLAEKHITLYKPVLPLNNQERLAERLVKELKGENLPLKEVREAVKKGFAELERYREDVREYGRRELEEIRRRGGPAILLIGRPYHIDPEINHGITEMIASYGLPIISEDALYHEPLKEKNELPLVNQWSYHARLYHAAAYACEHPELTLIQLSSFGCGLDAITTTQVKKILDAHHKVYTMIKLDEVSNLGAARIRLRSLLATLARRRDRFEPVIPIVPRPRFTEEKAHQTIIAPQMAPIHFELFQGVLEKNGYHVEIPPMPTHADIDFALRYVNNDMCYPAIVVTAQILAALRSGRYKPEQTSVMLFQTCGACRATNYLSVVRDALKYSGYPQVPVFALYGIETDDFHLTRPMLIGLTRACIYGDLLMKVRNRMMPYELEKGSTQKLYRKWMERCREDLNDGSYFSFARNIREIVREFDELPIDESLKKPKVGIVGEILVKYHPVANNHLEDTLMQEGAEVVMPDFVDFFLYLASDRIVKHDLLSGSLKEKMASELFITFMELYRRPVKKALEASRHFKPGEGIRATAKMAERHVSLGNMAGEGWFLTGEMVKLIESNVKNIVCLQPFGCLPNHIVGKGVLHDLRTHYRGANIVAIDCEAGASEVNQLNRLKLMLTVAKDRVKNPLPQAESPENGKKPETTLRLEEDAGSNVVGPEAENRQAETPQSTAGADEKAA